MWEADGEASITSHTGAGISRARVLKRPALMVMEGSSAGRLFPIQSEKLTVGRSKQAGFSIEDEGISRMHCGVSFSEGAYVLSDLGSTNGTRVNSSAIAEHPLRDGDVITVGGTRLRYEAR